jgi:hypothetical protein
MSVPNQKSADGARVRGRINGREIRSKQRHQQHQEQERAAETDCRMAPQKSDDATPRLHCGYQVGQRLRDGDDRRRIEGWCAQ